MKIYDLIKSLLITYEQLRSSDKKLEWAVWTKKGLVVEIDGIKYISKESFYDAPSSASITRARRKVQENHTQLRANDKVKQLRKSIQATAGNFVYHEPA